MGSQISNPSEQCTSTAWYFQLKILGNLVVGWFYLCYYVLVFLAFRALNSNLTLIRPLPWITVNYRRPPNRTRKFEFAHHHSCARVCLLLFLHVWKLMPSRTTGKGSYCFLDVRLDKFWSRFWTGSRLDASILDVHKKMDFSDLKICSTTILW